MSHITLPTHSLPPGAKATHSPAYGLLTTLQPDPLPQAELKNANTDSHVTRSLTTFWETGSTDNHHHHHKNPQNGISDNQTQTMAM